MRFLRPVGTLVVIVILAFIFRNNLPYLSKSFQQFASDVKINSLASSTRDIASKLEETLPPPLRAGNQDGNSGSGSGNSTAISALGIITLTNEERADNGNLPALSENQKLDAAARAKANDMLAKQYFEHISPAGRGPSDLAKTAGYQYIMIGENLALGNFKNNQALLDAWMNSPGHRANILNGKFTEMGAAAVKGNYQGNEVWLAVQEFGRPLSDCNYPDQTLEGRINLEKADVDAKETQLEEKKRDIDSSSPKYGDAYNAKVNEYNSMVATYNGAVNQLKADINTYNTEVRSYNNCIAS